MTTNQIILLCTVWVLITAWFGVKFIAVKYITAILI